MTLASNNQNASENAYKGLVHISSVKFSKLHRRYLSAMVFGEEGSRRMIFNGTAW